MLISLSPFGNMSRFMRPGYRVHETALLLLDGDSISCSGTILAARSQVFELLLRDRYEIPLSGFDGMAHQVGQCLELMYGGQVLLDSGNISTFLKFSVVFEICELLNLCAVWMENKNLDIQSELILNEKDKTKCLAIIDSINFEKIVVYENGYSSDEESLDLDEICASFTDTTIENHTNQSNGHTATVVKSRGRLAAELSSLAAIEPALDTPHSANKENLNNLLRSEPTVSKSKRDEEWQKVPVKSKQNSPPKAKPEPIIKNPASTFKPNLSKWSKFTAEDLMLLSSPLCPYPEFAKLEVAISWLANSDLTHHQCQRLFDQFTENIDPLNLSDRYISLLSDYTNTWNVSFPSHFKPHIRNCYVPDDPNSKSKYFMHLWSLQRGDLAEIRESNYVSFFAKCPLCDKGTGESILKLIKATPCYDLKIDQYRRKKQKHGIEYPVHFHSNRVYHWLLKTGSGSRPILHSLVTSSFQTITNVMKKHDKLIVICLQLMR